jgi:hypothetical protein
MDEHDLSTPPDPHLLEASLERLELTCTTSERAEAAFRCDVDP